MSTSEEQVRFSSFQPTHHMTGLIVFQSTQTSGREKCRSREKYASFITYIGGPIRVHLKSCMILQSCFGVYRCHVQLSCDMCSNYPTIKQKIFEAQANVPICLDNINVRYRLGQCNKSFLLNYHYFLQFYGQATNMNG